MSATELRRPAGRALLGVGLLLAGASPARAALVTAGRSEDIARVSVVTVGEDSWVTVSAVSARVFVVPLPDSALDPQLVQALGNIEEDTAPREFRVERPPLCDPSWSCSVARPPIEPRGPGMPIEQPKREPKEVVPKKTAAVTPSPADGLGCLAFPGSSSGPPELAPRMRIIGRVGVQRVVEDFLEHAQSVSPRFPPDVSVRQDLETSLPNVSRFAVIESESGAVRFHVKGPFTWPNPSSEQGGPREVVMVVTVGEPTSGSVLFPRQLLQAEPPRLYLAQRYAAQQASQLADQLAAEGHPIQLERVMPVDPADKTQRIAKDLGLTDPKLFVGTTLPPRYRLFRYRFRGTRELGLSRMSPAELPHPREIATGFITVDVDEFGSPLCPRKFGACYRPQLRNGEWVRRISSSWSAGAAGGERMVEAPFSLATLVMRDPSPAPVSAAPLAAPAQAVDAGAPSGASAAPSASGPSAPRAPGMPPSEAPGARGCACDSSASSTNASRFGSALSGLALGALVLAFRRRFSRG